MKRSVFLLLSGLFLLQGIGAFGIGRQHADGLQLSTGAAQLGIVDKLLGWLGPCKALKDKFQEEIASGKVKADERNRLEIKSNEKKALEKLAQELNSENEDIKLHCATKIITGNFIVRGSGLDDYKNLTVLQKKKCDEQAMAHLTKLRSCVSLLPNLDKPVDITERFEVPKDRREIEEQIETKLKLKVADINKPDDSNNTPLMNAITQNDMTAMELLLDAGADVNFQAKKDESNTALTIAIRNKNLNAIKRLLEMNADVKKLSLSDGEPKPALCLAVRFPSAEGYIRFVVDKLLKQGADATGQCSVDGRTPILVAAQFNNFGAIRPLIASGANVDDRDWLGDTPLIIAAKSYRPELVEELLEASADVNAKNTDKKTALDLIIFHSHSAKVSGKEKLSNIIREKLARAQEKAKKK